MSDLYLTKVAVKNFRTFGDLQLDLPAAPGITLIVGPNGLGKSSFFDSIEWALTGTIRRFGEYLKKSLVEEDYLTRRGANKDSHRVELFFGNRSVIREAGTIPSSESVVNLLKGDKWAASIEDLSTYLAFTHFLGQASNQRFTSRNSDEQWNAVKGPSGIDRLEEVRNSLRGRATLNAFNRRIDRDVQEVTKCAENLTRWRLLVERALRLRQVADAGGALSQDAIMQDVARLEERGRFLSGNERIRSPFPFSLPENGVNRLSDLRNLLEDARTAREHRLASISALVETTTDYGAVRAAADAGSPTVDTAKASVDELLKQKTQLSRSILQKQDVLRKRREEAASHKNQLVLLKRTGEDRQLIKAHRQALSLAEDEISRAEISLNRLLSEQAEVAELVGKGRQIEAVLKAANSEIDRVSNLLRRVREIEIVDGRYQQARSEGEQAEREIDTMAVRRRVLRERIDVLETEVVQAQTAISLASERASEIASALASIAIHISAKDTECPLCKTRFPAGELELLVRSSSQQSDGAMAAAQELFASCSRQLQLSETELRALSERHDRLLGAIQTAGDLRTTLINLRRGVASELKVPEDQDLSLALSVLQRTTTEAQAEARKSWEAFVVTEPQRVGRVDQIESDIHSFRRSLEIVVQRKDALARDLRATEERLRLQGRSSETEAELTQSTAFEQASVEALSAEIESNNKELEHLASDEALISRRLLEAQAQLSSREAEMESASKNAAAIEAQWKAAGMSGLPSAASLSKRRTEVAQELKEIDLLLTEQERLVEAFQKTLRIDELQTVNAQLDSIGGAGAAADPELHEKVLTQQLEQAEAGRRTSESALVTVSALAETLQKSASEFSKRSLLPLNDLIDQFNEALLSYPGETIRFKASHHVNRTKFDMQLRYRDQIDDAVYNKDLPPQIVLSEGQLAANGFSILCAASVAYPWSKWRALLLDDPLQHNDIIHAAAFVDLMRNLVEQKGYQLLMSSHERSEADFIRRKFDAAGIPCTVLELTAPSRSGVTYMPVRYNQAAKALL